MRWSLLLVLALALTLPACGDKEPEPAKNPPTQTPYGMGAVPKPAGIDQGSPTALAEGIFAAARSGNLASLSVVVAPEGADRQAKNVATVSTAAPEQQAEFKAYFAKGKATGEKIEGDKAAVTILFGPDGTKKETFNMVKVAGKWYLESF